ncbi:MAG: 3-deoxy-manno-octulosonate cytidylyltransferase [Chitinophagales bacterium]|nr:3-deoxy-manno-octulosonate cytidylyltransferase [Chitinophagales bacterium]MCZ2394654.1 3-deoxy-manno-octulosonate cytidylyltransferase [Chitinophagales bacterium]
MKITGIIPARYASSRFPGKPLVLIDGKPMIQHVYEQCKQSTILSDIIIATDHQEILKTAIGFGAKAVMTSPQHLSGTDRCAEVAEYTHTDAIINIQGDEPRIHPQQINQLGRLLIEGFPIATLAIKTDFNNAQNHDIVKVVKNIYDKALYFSRAPIPYHSTHLYFQHIGIYGFQKEILLEISKLSPSQLELSEKLEQLRWLENGYEIIVGETQYSSISIDRPEDLLKI